MSEVSEISARWVPLERASERWALSRHRLETLIALGVVVVGKDSTGGLYIDQNALETRIQVIPPRSALALLSELIVHRDELPSATSLTLTAAAARVRVAAKTLRNAIQAGQLIAKRTGSGPRASYCIDPQALHVWSQMQNPNSQEAFISLGAERKETSKTRTLP